MLTSVSFKAVLYEYMCNKSMQNSSDYYFFREWGYISFTMHHTDILYE